MKSGHDVHTRARYLLRRAAELGKPLRVFLGFRVVTSGRYEPVAYDSAENVMKRLPRAEMLVDPAEDAAALAQRLSEHFTALEQQRKAAPQATAKPKRTHQWFHGEQRYGRKRTTP